MCRLNNQRNLLFFLFFTKPVTTVDALWNFIRIDINAYTKPEGNQSGTQNQTTSSGAQNQTSPNGADIPKKYLYGQGDDGKRYSTPTMVFSVIGDSDSFVPRPWPTTLFQTALIEAAKSGGGMTLLNNVLFITFVDRIA